METVPDKRRDTESMASSMRKKTKMDPIISPEACIFRNPSILKRHNEAAYVPNAFSIGPFHHGKESLKDAERIKHKYLGDLVDRRGSETMLNACIDAIKGIVSKVRKCYAAKIGMDEEDFIEMLAVDGCFIIELFRKDANVVPKDKDDPIFTMSCMLQFLYQDLILLENQLPWFVLQELFRLTGGSSESKSLIQLALEFFENTFTSEKKKIEVDLFANREIKHILDFLRLSLVLPLPLENEKPSTESKPSPNTGTTTTQGNEQVALMLSLPPENEKPSTEPKPSPNTGTTTTQGNEQVALEPLPPLPSATKMAESGIKFLKVASNSILDVKFTGGRFEMPTLLIQETTEPAFRNLISYEQCYPNCPPRVTCYAMMLDNLINTTEDIDQLAKKKILINWLNPQDATHFFQKLYQDAYVKDLYYQKLCGDVQEYRKRWWPRWRAFYISNYFGKPWAIISQVAATILLVLTVLQTMYAMKPDEDICSCLKTVSRTL